MKLVVQRVSSASVEVQGEKISAIKKGLFVLIGVEKGDDERKAKEYADKLSRLRILADSVNKMNLSVLDTKSSVLVVSQFTLASDTSKGNRPSFLSAEDPKKAEIIYNYFISELIDLGVKVKTGRFGEYMKINVSLDGPVTIVL